MSARRAGAALLEGCEVQSIETSSTGVTGLKIAGEVIRHDAVVIAAGGWSAELLGPLGWRPPLKTFALSVAALVGAPGGLPFVSHVDDRWYLIERAPGMMLLGMPPEAELVSAATLRRQPAASRVTRYIEMLRRRLRGFDRARSAGGWTGLLSGTPDGRPLLGPHPQIDGLHLATGFAGGGVQWVASNEVVADILLGRTPRLEISAFLASRYADWGGADFEFDERGPYFYDEPVSVS
jgi:glycine/D-amino acid oxidase-like deaminating enzyme